MPAATDRLEFGPPRDGGSPRAFGLALLAHVLLIAALTWGVNWKSSDKAASFEAEIWSSVPQQAAPRLVEAPPPPPPPPPQPTAAPQARPEPPPAPEVDIALEQEKKRKLQREREQAEAEKAAEKAAERKAELAAQKKKRQEELDKQAREDLKAEQAKRKAADEAKKAEAKKQDQLEDKQKQAQATAAAAKQRQDAMNRMMGLAGASGNADAKGSALKSSGPSASYGGKVRAAVKPNVVFTDDVVGNPKAEVEVRTTPDGTITSRRIITSSGNKSWDEAVLKAIDRTQVMPRDTDGRVPSPMILEFRPKD